MERAVYGILNVRCIFRRKESRVSMKDELIRPLRRFENEINNEEKPHENVRVITVYLHRCGLQRIVVFVYSLA